MDDTTTVFNIAQLLSASIVSLPARLASGTGHRQPGRAGMHLRDTKARLPIRSRAIPAGQGQAPLSARQAIRTYEIPGSLG